MTDRGVTDVLRPGTAAPQVVATRPTPWEVGRRYATRRTRLLVGLGVLFTAVCLLFGFPTGREVITLWVLALLFAVVGGDVRAWRTTVVRDWLPLLVVLFAYDLLRGFAKGSVSRAHVLPQLRAEEWLFGGGRVTPTEWLQERLYSCIPSWYDYLAVPVYMSHFVVPMAVAAGLWATSYARFKEFVWSLVTLTAMTLLTYAAFPAVPPWMASQRLDPETGQTLLPYTERVPSHVLEVSGVETIHNAVQRGEAYANPVAAIPSLHSAVPMLVLLLAWPYCRRLGRTLLVVYIAAMTFTLVYGGEHYVVDAVIGWAYAALAVVLVRRVRARRARAAVAGAEPPRAPAPAPV